MFLPVTEIWFLFSRIHQNISRTIADINGYKNTIYVYLHPTWHYTPVFGTIGFSSLKYSSILLRGHKYMSLFSLPHHTSHSLHRFILHYHLELIPLLYSPHLHSSQSLHRIIVNYQLGLLTLSLSPNKFIYVYSLVTF